MRPTLLILVLAALVAGVLVVDKLGYGAGPTRVEPGSVWKGELKFDAKGRRDFEVELPDDAVLARITLSSDVAGVELCAQPERAIKDPNAARLAADDSNGPPTLVLDALGPDPVAGATWFVSAHWPFVGEPRSGDRLVAMANLELEVECFTARVDAELEAGAPIASTLEESSGGFRTFRITVPKSARALRLDLFDVSSDLDLYARAGEPILALGEDVAFAEHNWGHETLVLDAASEPPLEPGEWYVDVVDSLGPTRTLPFRILASFDAGVPELLRGAPRLPQQRAESGLARALAAVVEIATDAGLGSGTLLTRDGWILTNAHVVGEDPSVEIVVSLTLDPTLPAEESFRARVERLDLARDLALLRIVSGLYGQPLPANYALPTLELGSSAALTIGEPLWLVGYPATGGTGSRVTISATRGIVSGFERADFGVLVKTDAEITRGNSGGAAVDERGLLVGLPTSTVENGSGQIGYVHPIDALPAEWRELLVR
jgi:S1-C subfamily serine protease